jgi:hypothetical protein
MGCVSARYMVAYDCGRDAQTNTIYMNRTDLTTVYQTYQNLIYDIRDPRRESLSQQAFCPLGLNVFRVPQNGHTVKSEVCQDLETTQKAFDDGVGAWRASHECKKIKDTLMATGLPKNITKIIAFACCTMSGARDELKSRITQHALILTIRDVLQEKNPTADGEIKCYAQDPLYTDVDKAILKGAGVQVLNDPFGFLEVDDSSVVISFAPGIPVRQIIADIARPAIMIWNSVVFVDETWSRHLKDLGDNELNLRDAVEDYQGGRLVNCLCPRILSFR